MKKIMFCDKFGLTKSVLEGKKTMTRRIIKGGYVNVRGSCNPFHWCFYAETLDGLIVEVRPAFEIGEVVAIAQRYKDICLADPIFFEGMRSEAGWNNKMFVCAEYMPHRIRITDIKVERVQSIIEEDAVREGVIEWMGGFIVPGIMENHGKNNEWFESACSAFLKLFRILCGCKMWSANPWVFVYTFELVQ